jgi:uncharacterized protein YprB with RNaseH-like and TPR domain
MGATSYMPDHDELRKRLEKYLGGPVRAGEGAPKTGPPTRKRWRPEPPPAGAPRRVTLEDAAPGYAVRVPERGNAYKLMTPLPDGTDGDGLRAAFAAAVASPETPAQQRIRARCGECVPPEDVLFFDLETTGLGQTPLFLIGTMTWEGENLLVRQFFARDLGEEAAVIQLFVELAAAKRLLVSFNGKSFDLPMVYQRAETHGVPCILHAHHFDLLHECRRVWRAQLPNCQLQTLETRICGAPPRSGEIPSAEIPDAYAAFLRNGNALPIAQILRHNVQDLLTMASLLSKLPPLKHSDGMADP